MPISLRRPAAIAAGMVVGVALLSGTGAALGATSLKLTVDLPDRCAEAHIAPLTNATFRLKKADGTLKDSMVSQADSDGIVGGCFSAAISATDRISIKVGTASHVAIVPRLGLTTINRVSDVVTGKGPKNSSIRLIVHDCPMGTGCGFGSPVALSRTVTVNSSGTWSVDLTSAHNLIGWNIVEVRKSDAAHDLFYAQRTVPAFEVTSGNSFVGGKMPPGGPFAFTLKQGTTLLATASLSGESIDQFRDPGSSPVNVAAGNAIAGAFASDAKMLVPDLSMTADADADTVLTHCFAHQPFHLNVFGTNGGELSGFAGSDGVVSVTVSPAIDMAHGDGLRIACQTSHGDRIQLDGTAP